MLGSGKTAGIMPPTNSTASANSAMRFLRTYEDKNPDNSVPGMLTRGGTESTICTIVRGTSGYASPSTPRIDENAENTLSYTANPNTGTSTSACSILK